MNIKIVYVFKPKQEFIAHLTQVGCGDLLECVGGPLAWTNDEPDSDFRLNERIDLAKSVFLGKLLEDYDRLGGCLGPGATCSADTVDQFWTVERLELEGDLHTLDSQLGSAKPDIVNVQQQRYLVRLLDDLDFKPCPDAAFEVQVFNTQGQGEICAYFGRDSHHVLAVIHATRGRMPAKDCRIPIAVIRAAQGRLVGLGQEVDETGKFVRPTFLSQE